MKKKNCRQPKPKWKWRIFRRSTNHISKQVLFPLFSVFLSFIFCLFNVFSVYLLLSFVYFFHLFSSFLSIYYLYFFNCLSFFLTVSSLSRQSSIFLFYSFFFSFKTSFSFSFFVYQLFHSVPKCFFCLSISISSSNFICHPLLPIPHLLQMLYVVVVVVTLVLIWCLLACSS